MKEYIIELPDDATVNDCGNLPFVGRLVRCRDCLFGETEMNDGIYYCTCATHGSVGHTGNYYCADGVRKYE